MKRCAVFAATFFAGAVLLLGCAPEKGPRDAGEEYGATLRHGDPLVACVVESTKRYPDDKSAGENFLEACRERAER